jgi:hypothetical protein
MVSPKAEPQYFLSGYTEEGYVFSIPLKARTPWLKKTLEREKLVSGLPLARSQFSNLKKRLPDEVELAWQDWMIFLLECAYDKKRMIVIASHER